MYIFITLLLVGCFARVEKLLDENIDNRIGWYMFSEFCQHNLLHEYVYDSLSNRYTPKPT
jgi:hypothetical protein